MRVTLVAGVLCGSPGVACVNCHDSGALAPVAHGPPFGGQRSCRQAGLHAGRFRPLRAQDRLRHAGPGARASPSARPIRSAGLARPPRTFSSTASGSPTNRAARSTQLRRASLGGQRRPDRNRRRRQPGHRGADRPGRQRHREGKRKGSAASSNGTPTSARIMRSRTCFRGSISYSGKAGPVDYTFSMKNQTGRGGFGGPVRDHRRARRADRDAATRSITRNTS